MSCSEPFQSGTCPQCSAEFCYMLMHHGFDDSAYLYCNQCGRMAHFSAWSGTVPPGAPVAFQARLPAACEPFVAPCVCGGQFKAAASPRCPECRHEFDAVAMAPMLEAGALGTEKGWRWQRNWRGQYGFIIAGRVVNDPWREPA